MTPPRMARAGPRWAAGKAAAARRPARRAAMMGHPRRARGGRLDVEGGGPGGEEGVLQQRAVGRGSRPRRRGPPARKRSTACADQTELDGRFRIKAVVTYPTPVVWRPAGWRKSQDKDRGDESCTDRLEECKLGRVIWAGYSKNRTRIAAVRRDLGDEEQAAGLALRCAACEECARVRFRTFLPNSPFGAVRRQIDAGEVILELTPDAGWTGKSTTYRAACLWQ
jgi:hypothetical protein